MEIQRSPPGENFREVVTALLARVPQVQFAYLFGSRARGAAGPLSDVDVAVYLDRRLCCFDWRLRIMEQLAHVLQTEHFDLVTLNDASPVLRYEVIRNGEVIKEDKKRRVDFETRALAEYLDTAFLRKEQREYLKRQLTGNDVHGQ